MDKLFKNDKTITFTTCSGGMEIKMAKGGKILSSGNTTICGGGMEIKMADDKIICDKGIKIKMPTDKDWQNQQIDDKEMAMIKDRGKLEELKREKDDYWDIVNFLDTEELLRLLKTEILIYNMENTDG